MTTPPGRKRLKGEHQDYKAKVVYVATNPAWPEWSKIGSAAYAHLRLRQFNQHCPLKDFSLTVIYDGPLYREVEPAAVAYLHRELLKSDGEDAFKGEWVRVPFERAAEVVLACVSVIRKERALDQAEAE